MSWKFFNKIETKNEGKIQRNAWYIPEDTPMTRWAQINGSEGNCDPRRINVFVHCHIVVPTAVPTKAETRLKAILYNAVKYALSSVYLKTLWHWCCLPNIKDGSSFWRPELRKMGNNQAIMTPPIRNRRLIFSTFKLKLHLNWIQITH